MRLRHRDGTAVHLSYCTNVHPAEDLAGIVRQLDEHAEPVRHRLGADRLGLGLWLPGPLAAELAADGSAVTRLRAELTARGLEVVSLNGFPYRGFHAPVVKHDVYLPDWSDPARLAYTLDLARVLTRLLPDDAARGSISTLPLGWRTWWTPEHRDAAQRQLALLTDELATLREREGRAVRIAFEPEPGCVVERTEEAVEHLGSLDHSLIGVCLDTCHLAVGFEEPEQALDRLSAAGLPVVKVQASCALHADDPKDPPTAAALARFVEPRFLHQTREAADPRPLARDDLGMAMHPGPELGALPGRAPWRVHFHTPLHAEPAAPLRSTRPVLEETLARLLGGERALTDHIEVETYTWSVLPEGQRPEGPAALSEGIAAELHWARDYLNTIGLEEVPS
ncbi:metabolite traffic protein EboE [Streptomyces sp. NPDC085540]|uniref:metabolite traffic protein EboE n=1 Tax=Streptomyces sp. NPDC085540 TaxID=3365730 RepID=UPI0037CEB122